MKSRGLSHSNTDGASAVAFVLIVVASYASWFINAGNLDLAAANLPLAVGLGVLYCVVGTVGFAWVQQSRSDRQLWIATYFLMQFAAGFWASWLLKGINSITILLLPLAWQSVLTRSATATILVNPMLCLGIVLLYGVLRPSWADAWRMSATLIAGIIAAILFGRLAVRAQDARAESSRLAADLQAKNAELRAYAATAEEAAIAAERNRLAREIHDSLGHYLTASAMQVQSARAMLTSSGLAAQVPEVVDALRKAEGLSQEVLVDVRRSVTALRETSIIQPSLPQAIRELCQSTEPRNGVAVRFTVTGHEQPLPPQAELTLYRVGQEGLTNIYKHAQASFAQVVLCYESRCVRLTVEDDGIGVTANHLDTNRLNRASPEGAVSSAYGFGLLGLRERLSLLGGKIDMKQSRVGGVLLQVEVPL